MNHWYLVSAHVVEADHREEKFTSLSYAGFLPGYTLGFNHHGLVYSINTLSAAVLRSGKIRESLSWQRFNRVCDRVLPLRFLSNV